MKIHPAQSLALATAALFCAWGIQFTPDFLEEVFHNGTGFSDLSDVLFGQNRLVTALEAAAFYLLFRAGIRPDGKGESTGWKITFAVLAFFPAFMDLLGASYFRTGSWDLIFSGETAGFAFSRILASTMLLYGLYSAGLNLAESKGFFRPRAEITPCTTAELMKPWGILLVCWLPWYVLRFPGILPFDTYSQIMQYLGLPTTVLERTGVTTPGIFITNHHPAMLTFLFGGFYSLGQAAGNAAIGIAALTGIQTVFLAGICAGAVRYLGCAGFGRWKWILLAFFALNPIFPCYATTLLKDTTFSCWFLALSVLLFEMTRTSGGALKNPRYLILLSVCCLGFVLSKNQGVYLLFLTGIALCFAFRTHWIRIAAVFFGTCLAYQVLWLKIVLPLLNVGPGGEQEFLSVPFQQTGRYVVEWGAEVTPEEQEAIDRVINYKSCLRYRGELANPIKNNYRHETAGEGLPEYLKVWFRQGLKHPLCYIEAELNLCSEYFTPASNRGGVIYPSSASLAQNKYAKLYEKKLRIQPAFRNSGKISGGILDFLLTVPVLSLLFCTGACAPIAIVLAVLMVRNGRKKYLLAFLPLLLSILVNCVSPAAGKARYALPFFFVLPFMAAAVFRPSETNPEKELHG